MSKLYACLYDRVYELRASGFEPDRIVVSSDEWLDVKEQAEVREGEGYAGSDLTLINGVETLHRKRMSGGRIIFREGDTWTGGGDCKKCCRKADPGEVEE